LCNFVTNYVNFVKEVRIENGESMKELEDYIIAHGGINYLFVEKKCKMPRRTIQKGRHIPVGYYDVLRRVLAVYYGFRAEIAEDNLGVGYNTTKEGIVQPEQSGEVCEWFKGGMCSRAVCEHFVKGVCRRSKLREYELRINKMNKAVMIGEREGGIFRRIELEDGSRVWLE
jgi:hypothetical protein